MKQTPTWAKALIIVEAALVLIFFAVAAEKSASSAELMETAQTVCGDAMEAIEMDLRAGETPQPSDIQSFYTITRLYENTPQAMLAEELHAVKTDCFSEMSQEDRDYIADCIQTFYSDNTTSEELTEYYNTVQKILRAETY